MHCQCFILIALLSAMSIASVQTSDCGQGPLELGIVLDSSSSIRRESFNQAKVFLQDFLSQYEIGPDQVRVSLISYGFGVYLEEAFNLPDHTTIWSLQTAVRSLKFMRGSRTGTDEGIEYMRSRQLSRDVTREGVERVAIVLTDGNSKRWRNTEVQAERARATGIVMIAVGVGSKVSDRELLNIAGNTSRVYRVDSYAQLNSIKTQLESNTCTKKKNPTTPAPVCGKDIYFVFSAADLGPQTSGWTKKAIAQTVKSEDIQHGFRIGVVTGSCPDDAGFDLDQYLLPKSSRQLIDHLDPLVEQRLPSLVERVLTVGFSEEHGGRATSSHVTVLVAPGGKKNKKLRAVLVEQAERLVVAGIQVFILDPFGTGVSAAGAVTISEKNPVDASTLLVFELSFDCHQWE